MTAPFRDVFERAARRVRFALAARAVLDAGTLGAVGALLGAVTLASLGKPPWAALGTAVVAAAIGYAIARQRRFDDADVALFLDARLASGEVVTSALGDSGADDVRERIADAAVRVLGEAAPDRIAPRALFPRHAAVPLLLAAAVLAPRLLPAPRPKPSPQHATPRVAVALDELRRVEALKDLAARTDAERARQAALSEAARALAEKAAQGMDQRDALAALGKLRDGVDAERFAGRTTESARRAAAQAFAKNPELARAAQALARADLVAFDAEMDRLARSLESDARKTALAALDEAREAAIARGDGELGRSLEEEHRLLKKRAADSAALRDFSKLLEGALPWDGARTLKRLERDPGASAEALTEAMANAVEGLTPEERARLAKKLASLAGGAEDEQTLSKAKLDELTKALATNEGREALKRALKALANDGGQEDGKRERALAAASAAIALAETRVGAGASGTSPGDANGSTPGSGDGTAGDPSNGAASPGGGKGSHAGDTPAVAGSSFVSRAAVTPFSGIPIGPAPGLSPALAEAHALRPSSAALSAARSREVGAVERSNVPREYREQVGRYFAP